VSDQRLREVTLALSAELLVLGGVFDDVSGARAVAERALDDGSAAERFAGMVAELGGPSDLLESPNVHLRAAPVARAVEPGEPGTVTALGELVGPGERPLAIVNAREEASADQAAEALRRAFVLGDGAVETAPIVMEVLR
jgi:thymidine phosphorylase